MLEKAAGGTAPAAGKKEAASGTKEGTGGTWRKFSNIDMCFQGDAEIIGDWKRHHTIASLKQIVEQKGYSAVCVGSFGHAALKSFNYQLTAEHCKPSHGYTNELYIWFPEGGKGARPPPEPSVPSVTMSGFHGYNERLNGLYTENVGETCNGKPVFKHMHHVGVGAGHDWCRLYWAHG